MLCGCENDTKASVWIYIFTVDAQSFDGYFQRAVLQFCPKRKPT